MKQPLESEVKSLEREVPLLPASNVASRVIRLLTAGRVELVGLKWGLL